jgi:hypothetical protein
LKPVPSVPPVGLGGTDFGCADLKHATPGIKQRQTLWAALPEILVAIVVENQPRQVRQAWSPAGGAPMCGFPSIRERVARLDRRRVCWTEIPAISTAPTRCNNQGSYVLTYFISSGNFLDQLICIDEAVWIVTRDSFDVRGRHLGLLRVAQ